MDSYLTGLADSVTIQILQPSSSQEDLLHQVFKICWIPPWVKVRLQYTLLSHLRIDFGHILKSTAAKPALLRLLLKH